MDKKEYRYRKHIYWGQYIVPIFFAILIIGCWGGLFILANTRDSTLWDLSLPLAVLSVIVFIEATLLWYLCYRMAGVRVSVGEVEIQYRHRGGVVAIPVQEITQLNFPSIKYMGGWIKIISPAKKIRLTVVVEDIGGFLEELKDSIDKNGRADCYDQDKFFRFLKTATYADQSWSRLYWIFGKLIIFSILCTIAGGLFALCLRLNILFAFFFAYASGFYPLIVYLCVELFLMRKFAINASKESFNCTPPDQANEKELFRKATTLGILVYSCMAILGFFLIKYVA